MIQKVSFRNFKAYRSLDLELEPFTVLVGPNASGKTTLLEGLHHFSVVAYEMLAGGRGFLPTNNLQFQSYGVKAPIELSVSGRWKGIEGSASASCSPEPYKPQDGSPPYFPFKLEGEWNGAHFWAGDWGKTARPNNPHGLHGDLETASFQRIREALSATTVLRFQASSLSAASYSEEAVPQIGTDGSGLASVLAYLKLSQDEIFSEIELALKQVVPSVRRIRLERAVVEQRFIRTLSLDEQQHQIPETRTLWGQRIVLDMRGAKGVAADAAGEGTLMVLGLLTVLMSPQKPRLVLLDDLEMRLHPVAQAKLIEVLRRLQQNDPELQIIATSHSPFILNYLDPKEVRMTFLAENGFARCEKLSAHPEFERWKDLMSPGEFWSTVGESWLEKAGETASHE
ncbi:AAA family ATPase [Archangium violaceum]|uniref:AAA family ATPase n=1 Tax=Archangium violaceum TaxID=83451 RepID=UPI00193C4D08|nr:ATP-binding protein [Archangium violaceum]QRK12067.1 AAA family ATPase [Archangium violaceum]